MNPMIKEYLNKIKHLEGFPELFKYLKEQTDYFKAPASAKYHSSYEEGLVDHSCNVVANLLGLTETFHIKWDRPESPYIIGLFHDLCKTNFYTVEYRNTKNEAGEWVKVPYYSFDEKEPLGHGSKSVIILQRYLKLTTQEEFCIFYHMGGFGDDQYRRDFGDACRLCPELMLVALADQAAGCYEDRVRRGKENVGYEFFYCNKKSD